MLFEKSAECVPCVGVRFGSFPIVAEPRNHGQPWLLGKSLREELIEIGAKVTRHSKYVLFQRGGSRGGGRHSCRRLVLDAGNSNDYSIGKDCSPSCALLGHLRRLLTLP